MYGYIYKITNLINNKIYIGKTTTTVEKRFTRHIKHALNPEVNHKNLYLYTAMCKYGVENFKVEQIDTATTIKALDEKEQYWIAFYHSFIDDPLCNGYNMTIGGDGGHWSKESAIKAQQTKIKNGTNHHSEATRFKMSVVAKGKQKSELHKKHLSDNHHLKTTHVLYFRDGHVELDSHSIKHLAERLGVSTAKLRRASEVAEFRCGDFFLLDLTNLDTAFYHKIRYCKQPIVLDPITKTYMSPVSLRAFYEHHRELYDYKMPQFIYCDAIEREREEFIATYTTILNNALNGVV